VFEVEAGLPSTVRLALSALREAANGWPRLLRGWREARERIVAKPVVEFDERPFAASRLRCVNFARDGPGSRS
jgi:hypothetical protein